MSGDTTRQDETIAALSVLAAHEPDRARTAATRARCHAALERQRPRERRFAGGSVWAAWRRSLEPALVGCLCAVYLVEVLARAWRLYGF
jgi:hypothetical protein